MRKPKRVKVATRNPMISSSNNDGDDGRKYGFDDLPECLQRKILTCLPLKSLFLFKSVSKQWNSFISADDFPGSYIAANKGFSPNRTLLLLCSDSKDNPFVNHDEDRETVCCYTTIEQRLSSSFMNDNEKPFTMLGFPFPRLWRGIRICCEPHVVVSACNGLLLCWTWGHVYGICNPITRQWIVLPRHNMRYHTRTAFVARVDESSSKLISYRVVFLRLDNPLFSSLRMDIYDSDTEKWTKSEMKLPGGDFLITVEPMQTCYLDEIIHWEFSRGEVHYAAAVDPYKLHCDQDQCRLMVLPTASIFTSGTTRDTLLGVCNGKLQYLKIHETGHDMAIWVLENYDNEIWELKHMLTGLNLNHHDHGVCRPLAFHPMDSNIIYIRCTTDDTTTGDTIIIAFNIEKKTLSPVSTTARVESYIRVFPFVLPLWPLAFDCPYTTTNLCSA